MADTPKKASDVPDLSTGRQALVDPLKIVDPILSPLIERVLVTTDSLRFRVQELAVNMAAYYKPLMQPGQHLVLICILKGSYMFTADLARALHTAGLPNFVEFMCVSSYGNAQVSSGQLRVLMDLRRDVYGQHCCIVEDICDSGRTLHHLQRNIQARQPATVKTVVLLDKPDRRTADDVVVDWVGFQIPDVFVVGYGLDYDEFGRDIPFLAILKQAAATRALEQARGNQKRPAKL